MSGGAGRRTRFGSASRPSSTQSRARPQRWNWHQLDPSWACRVVADARLRPGQLAIDLGAGEGALSVPILATGARLIAVELHPRRAERLREALAPYGGSVVRMSLLDFCWPGQDFRVVANPPFTIAAELIGRLLGCRNLAAADLVLPRHLVDRQMTRTRSRHFALVTGLTLPPRAFSPPAPTPCAVLKLRRRR